VETLRAEKLERLEVGKLQELRGELEDHKGRATAMIHSRDVEISDTARRLAEAEKQRDELKAALERFCLHAHHTRTHLHARAHTLSLPVYRAHTPPAHEVMFHARPHRRSFFSISLLPRLFSQLLIGSSAVLSPEIPRRPTWYCSFGYGKIEGL
jgi:hypothetical protein